MTLPSYIRYVQGDSSISYNESTREVTWILGDFSPASEKTAAFQVSLLPSASQRGTSPVLVSAATLTGFDRFVQQDIETSAPQVNTAITKDPAYSSGKGTVSP